VLLLDAALELCALGLEREERRVSSRSSRVSCRAEVLA